MLQFLLRRRGVYGGPIDGHYGARTAAALRRYQSAAGLAADGIAGPATSIALARGTRAAARSAPSVAVASSSGSSGQLYVVRAGDNLTLLAQRFGLSLGGLASANGIDPAKPLIIGTKLRIRTLSATPSTPASVPTASASSVRDALGVWATHYGVDPQLARALSWQESGSRRTSARRSERGARCSSSLSRGTTSSAS